MSDKPKPFAEVHATTDQDGDDVGYRLHVAGQALPFSEVHWLEYESIAGLAAALNAAVEAREAPLRAALAGLFDSAREFAIPLGVARLPVHRDLDRALTAAAEALDGVTEAVSGDVACGLALEMGRLQAKFEGVWMVLADKLCETGGELDKEGRQLVQLLLEQLGINPNPPVTLPASMRLPPGFRLEPGTRLVRTIDRGIETQADGSRAYITEFVFSDGRRLDHARSPAEVAAEDLEHNRQVAERFLAPARRMTGFGFDRGIEDQTILMVQGPRGPVSLGPITAGDPQNLDMAFARRRAREQGRCELCFYPLADTGCVAPDPTREGLAGAGQCTALHGNSGVILSGSASTVVQAEPGPSGPPPSRRR